jgi:hypothetical protein
VKLNLISPYVYWLMHKITTRRYVGSRRANECPPLQDIGKVYFSSGPFEKDSKYEKSFKKNPDDYIIKILMTGTEEEVLKEEKRHLDGYAVESNRYVNKCGSWPPPPMFGEDNPAKRPEVRRKIGEAMSGEKNHNYGKTKSAETKRKMGEAHKGKIISAETRRKIGEAMKGVKKSAETKRKMGEAKEGEKNPNYGKTFSTETRRKMAEAGKRRPPPSAETRRKFSINNPMKRPEVVRKMVETKRRNRET